MKLEMLNHLYNQIKKIKCDIILITGNSLYGTDVTFSIIKHMYIDNPTNECIYTNVPTIKAVIDNNLNPEDYYTQLHVNYYYDSIMSRVDRIFRTEYAIKYIQPITHVNNCKDDDNFKEFTTMKATDGAYIYRISNYCLYIWKGLLNLNKSDIVECDIFVKEGYPNIPLVRFRVWKNKSLYIDHYVIYTFK